MDNAVLNSELIATKAGNITVYSYDGETREYISTSNEYLAVGIGIPACSCLDAPGTHKAGYAICRSADFNSWEYVPDHRGETVYSTKTGESKEITAPGDYPENTTTIAPLTPYEAETTRLNAVLDYIDAVTVTDTSTAPNVIWPELPEA